MGFTPSLVFLCGMLPSPLVPFAFCLYGSHAYVWAFGLGFPFDYFLPVWGCTTLCSPFGVFTYTCARMMVASVFPCGVLCGFLLLALFSSGSGHWLWSQLFLDLRALPPFLHTCVFACSCFSGLWLTTTPLWSCRLSSIQRVWRRWVWVLFRWRADWIPVSVFPGFFPL